MSRLSPASLEFARQHLQAYWDSDFFPKAFELQAVWAQWDHVRDYLAATAIEDLEVVLPRMMAAPKPDGSYRVVHQLDPLNVVVYTAAAFEVAEAVEQARPPANDSVACSYRIALDPANGRFFGQNNGFGDFVAQSRVLAGEFQYVLTSDITDFYNQIYLHRLQNALSSVAPALGPIATDIERFLTRLNDGVSHGIPVGPAASIIMSEALLLDIDAFIMGRGFPHTRYVDDFRIFSNDRSALHTLLQDLTKYLHSNHRLVLASGKTGIAPTPEFLETVLDEPEELERRDIHAGLTTIDVYDFDSGTADPADDPQRRIEVLRELMARVCAIAPLDLGLARHVLRRCRRYKIRAILPQLLDRLGHFVPVMNDVVLYLTAVLNRAVVDRHLAQFEAAFRLPEILEIEWVRYWAAELVVRNWGLLGHAVFRDFVARNGDAEHQARAAFLRRDVAWVRESRARIDELGGWPRRQLLWAGLALAEDERQHWYRNLQANNRPGVERWLLPWLISQ